MLTKLLIKTFIKNSDNIKNDKVRSHYGALAGIVGIVANIILFIIKLLVGLFTKSIAVTADAFNNFTDSASSLITIIGFKLSKAPADEEHPFGHGRIEYISALLVSFMVMFVGIQFIKSSFNRIINPQEVVFETVPFVLMLLSILIKIWLSSFNKTIGNKINSSALKASSFDALGDVVTSSVVAFSLLLSLWTSFPLDGYIGIVVALLILYNGYKLVKETLNPLLGEAPDPQLASAIKDNLMSYEYISGVHDLIIHNYGPGKCIASIHAEVPSDINIVKIHNIIDEAEREISEKLNIVLVIHMDPINVNDEEVNKTKNQIEEAIHSLPNIKSIHDLRIVGEGEVKNIIFDVVIATNGKLTHKDEAKLKEDINKKVQELHPKYNCIITVDRDFSEW
ncbi:Ferrous-iron efflux pump FieF [Clostridium sp. N3C]|uniref:cation diffusion facilitator family transporter n=1 Tax=Clostridium sp. N3C TaxID=1776758 RepID=UPI00092DF024|nr:cation diffusion facilitator family transporter [Clostridium sp. N3C]SCN24282.1 Ferrous-iron efflux pump FieF [Clostridium sp. N3C]